MHSEKTVIRVECCVCGAFIREVDGGGVTGVSHGYCKTCFENVMREIDERRKARMLCNVCKNEMHMASALVVTQSTEAMKGVAFVVFPAEGIDPEAVKEFGVCGIPCAAQKFTNALQESRGVQPMFSAPLRRISETPLLDEMETGREYIFVREEDMGEAA